MKKMVTINQCSDDTMWYLTKIGENYEYLFTDEFDGAYVVIIDMNNNIESRGSVLPDDCTITEVPDDYVIRPIEIVPTETEVLKSRVTKLEEELEVTQSALNEILMNSLGGM